MSEFNSCANLAQTKDLERANNVYDTLLATGVNPLTLMMDLQLQLQQDLHQKLPKYNKIPKMDEDTTCGEVLEMLRKQNDAIDDERRELYTSLGGMSNGEKNASAVWKDWKAQHEEFYTRKFSSLSDEDQLEVKFEMIDQIHFILNQLLTLGISSKELFVLYYLKNAENFARYDKQY